MRNGDAYKIKRLAANGVSESEIHAKFGNAYSEDEISSFIPKSLRAKALAKAAEEAEANAAAEQAEADEAAEVAAAEQAEADEAAEVAEEAAAAAQAPKPPRRRTKAATA